MATLGEADEATNYVSEGLSAARLSEDPWRIAHALMMLGGMLSGSGKYSEALERSQEALSLFRVLGDIRLIAVTLNTLGFVSIQLLHFHEAHEFLQESLALVTAAEDPWSAGTAYGNLGIVELARGNSDDAQNLLQKSIPLFADSGMLGDVAYFMTFLGESVLLQGATEDAESYWLDAIRIARETQALPTELAILVRLARLHAGKGNVVDAYRWARLVASHPAAWQDTHSRAKKLCAELEPKLTLQQQQSIRSSQERGSLEYFIQEILAKN